MCGIIRCMQIITLLVVRGPITIFYCCIVDIIDSVKSNFPNVLLSPTNVLSLLRELSTTHKASSQSLKDDYKVALWKIKKP